MANPAAMRKAILSMGLGKFAGGPPAGISNLQETIKNQIEGAKELGFDQNVMFLDPQTEAETLERVRAELRKEHYDGIMIGGGIRMPAEHTLLFEKLVQMSVRETKGNAKLMFSSRPDQIVEILTRNFPEMEASTK